MFSRLTFKNKPVVLPLQQYYSEQGITFNKLFSSVSRENIEFF